tara:strand:+ start:4250 stop:5572 length:1323 start_codon:yes stop_codon:yes gene_type:complete
MTTPYQIRNFRVDSVGVMFQDGTTVTIDKGAVLQLEYREGLFDKFLTVTLQLMDTTSKFSNALVGMEMFEVIFTDTQNGVRYEFTTDSKNGPLYAYNVHSKQIIDTGKSLTVELCRQDAILSMQKRVCKKYENQTADQLAGDIIVNELGQTKKGIFTQKSINKISFIPPNSRPLDVLIWARNKFIGDDQKSTAAGGNYTSAGFLFYETYDQYNYVSVDKLSGQTGHKCVFTTGTGTSTTQDAFRIENPEFVNTIDMVQNFDKGFYSGQIEFFDITECTMSTEKYTLQDLYPTWNKIGSSNYLPSMNSPAMKEDLKPVAPESPAVHSKYATRNMMVSFNKELFAGSTEDKSEDAEIFRQTVLQSVSRLGIFMNQVLTVTCNIGNMDLHAGDPVLIEFFDSQGNIDTQHSGRYIIADLTHLYTKSEDKLKTYLTLTRDSFGL